MSRSLSTTAPPASRRPGMDADADDAHPAWLQAVLRDPSAAPPRVYRWTVADVVRDGTAPAPKASPSDAADDRRRIYILGVGNLGRLFAASLSQSTARQPDPPPITLVVHRPGLLEQWHRDPGVRLSPPGGGACWPLGPLDVEMWSDEPPPPASSSGNTAELGPITNLIVATKAQAALAQVDRVRRYLGPASTVAFVQNGMNKLWPPSGAVYNAARYGAAAAAAPRWVACVVTHGVTSLGPFTSVLRSPADVKLGLVDGDGDFSSVSADTPFLVQQLLASSLLNAHLLPRPALWVTQLEKLAVNAVINPLTALLRCPNGELFRSPAGLPAPDGVPQIIDQLLREASAVFQGLARHDPSSRRLLGLAADDGPDDDDGGLLERLAFDALHAMVYRVGELVQHNNSSMLQDVAAGRPTEVREFNGWIVDTATYLARLGVAGIDAPGHRAMVRLVEAVAPLGPVTRAELGRHFEDVLAGCDK